jgi:uncharacterized protein (DUF927 family)
MSSFDLLDTVLPTEGRYCVLGIGRYPDQHFVDTREEVNEIAKKFVRGKVDAYFGCAKYGPLNNRTHENATYFRALWMDIDCGPAKGVPDEKGIIRGYLTQQIGLDEFKKFCISVGLPRPILVSSGYGIHAYWLLEEVVTRREWEPLANRLRELCVEQGLIVDSSVFEASRILRIPGTFNFKQDDPKAVTVLNEKTQRLTYEQFKELLGAPEPKDDVPDFIPRSMSPMMEALMGNKVKKFKTIMLRSAKGDGCQQLLNCFENQASIEEPLWRSALSIAAFCSDGDASAHKMSKGHPEYDPAQVDQKLAQLRAKGGPHHCATFEKLNPTGCDECPHKGKIKSPIVLGIEIEEADPDDNDFVVADEETGEETHYRIPEYPYPFFRGAKGGIYRRASEEEDEPTLVYEHDLYVVKRMKDSEVGEVALFRLHLPHDGVREFSISTASISAKDDLRKQLAHNGVMAHHKQYENLASFVVSFVKNLQYVKKAETMRTQFGWADGDSKFILGDREITKDGVFYSPPSSTNKEAAEKIHVKGDFAKWKEVFNLYALPGMEPHAFAALTAFGSPLLKFTGLEGAIINIISPESGSGKSTALYMCNSVSGQPKELTSMFKDTFNAKIHRLGVMNNLANTIDEITNMSGMEFSDLSYSISQGRGKDKMNGSTNTLRVNNTKWQGISLCSSNASFYEKLGVSKSTPDGESMRLLEYRVDHNNLISMEQGKQMFDHQLRDNYGHAMEVYAQWLVNNKEEAVDLMRQVQARIDKEVQFTQRERFWSGVAACNIAGGLVAKSLGLHDFDMKAVYEWLKRMLSEMRQDVKPPQASPITAVGEFINAHISNALVVNGEVDARSNLSALPLLEPRGELMIRYEPDTKELYIAAKAFKDFCVRQQINYKGTLKELQQLGCYIETMNKRMSKGMKMVSPAVRVLKFDASSSDFLQVDVQMSADENRNGVVPD